MKSKTIIIAILCTFLLLMLPNVNAVEYKEVKDEIKEEIEDRILKLQLLKCNIKDSFLTISSIISMFLIIYLIGFTYVFIKLFVAFWFLAGYTPQTFGDVLLVFLLALMAAIPWPIWFIPNK